MILLGLVLGIVLTLAAQCAWSRFQRGEEEVDPGPVLLDVDRLAKGYVLRFRVGGKERFVGFGLPENDENERAYLDSCVVQASRLLVPVSSDAVS